MLKDHKSEKSRLRQALRRERLKHRADSQAWHRLDREEIDFAAVQVLVQAMKVRFFHNHYGGFISLECTDNGQSTVLNDCDEKRLRQRFTIECLNDEHHEDFWQKSYYRVRRLAHLHMSSMSYARASNVYTPCV